MPARVVEGGGKKAAGAVGGAQRSSTRERRGIDDMAQGVYGPHSTKRGPLLVLRRREGNQSPGLAP